MNFVPALVSASLILTSFSAVGATTSAATLPDGTCSPEILADVLNLDIKMDQVLKLFAANTKQYARGEITKSEAVERAKATYGALRVELTKIQITYGDFICTSGSSVLKSAELYMMFDSLGSPDVSAKDGTCEPALEADYETLGEQARAEYVEMLSIARDFAANPKADKNEIRARVKKSSERMVSFYEAFRTKHPGKYTCYIVKDGQKSIVDSTALDESITQLRQDVFKY